MLDAREHMVRDERRPFAQGGVERTGGERIPAPIPPAPARRGRGQAQGRPPRARGGPACGAPARGTWSRTCRRRSGRRGRDAFPRPGLAAGGGGSYGRDLPTDGLAVYRSGDGQCIMAGMDTADRARPRPRGSTRWHRGWRCSACRRACSTRRCVTGCERRLRVDVGQVARRMHRPHARRSLRPGAARRPPPTFATRALAGEASVFNRRSLEGPGAGRGCGRTTFRCATKTARVIGALVVLVDVQALKDTEAALADRERQLSLIIDSVGFPITYVDRHQVIRFANQPSCEWSGRTRRR